MVGMVGMTVTGGVTVIGGGVTVVVISMVGVGLGGLVLGGSGVGIGIDVGSPDPSFRSGEARGGVLGVGVTVGLIECRGAAVGAVIDGRGGGSAPGRPASWSTTTAAVTVIPAATSATPMRL